MSDRLKTNAWVEAVFGPARTAGDRTVIPVARVAYAVGMGAGGGSESSASVAGGGGAATATPVAIVEITPGRVRVIPIVDVAKLATRALVFTAALAIAGMLLGRGRVTDLP